jgi:hypothetical protein
MVLYGLIWRKPAAGIEPIPFNAYRFSVQPGTFVSVSPWPSSGGSALPLHI